MQVDDRSGAMLEQWTGDQVAWTMARGYDGRVRPQAQRARTSGSRSACSSSLPFVDLRRPFRLLHLDLLVLLGFGVSHVFFNRGEIGVSVPLVYPVLLYLLVRMLFAGLPPARAPRAARAARADDAARGGRSCSCSAFRVGAERGRTRT